MAEKVGEIYYDVTLDTKKLIEGQRQVAAQISTASKNFDKLTDSTERAAKSSDGLATKITKIASATSALAAATFLLTQSDAYTKFNAQLKLATRSEQEFYQARQSSIRISDEAQASLTTVGTLYARISKATQEMGASQQRVADITRVVALSLKVSGAGAEESASAMLQLSQAFASGVLRGEEFNAVSEAAPRLLQALADGMRVPVGQLRNMASEGKITSDILATALPQSLQKLEEEAKSIQTIGGAFQQLRNQITLFVGEQMQASGASKMAAGTIASMADGVKTLDGAMDTFLTGAKAGAVVFAGVIAGEFAESVSKATNRLLDQAAASKAANTAELMRLKSLQTVAYETAATAASARAAALATAEQAAASVVAARAELALAAVEAERTAAVAALAQGTLTQAATAEAAVAASVRLASAKVAETEASAALTAAERALATARGQEALTAEAATASTVALTTAQRAQAAAATVAAAASRAAGAAMAMLGGPVGIAVIALGALALKWSSVKSAAEQAAEISESAARRIQKALSGSAEAPMRELMSVRDAAQAELAKVDAEIKQAEKWAKEGAGRWKEDTANVDTSDLDARREALRGVVIDSEKAIASMKELQLAGVKSGGPKRAGSFRASDNYDGAAADEPLKKPAATAEFKAKAIAAQAYYAGLVAENASALKKIDAAEKAELLDNQKRMVEDSANAGVYAKAKGEIQKKYARERAMLEEQTQQEVADLNIAITIDEVAKIEAVRVESVRRADAAVKLGTQTVEQAERAKTLATFNAERDRAALREQLVAANAETVIAATTEELTRIDLIRQENFRRADAAAKSGAITYAQAEADKARAAVEAQNSIRQQVLSINPLAALQQEYEQKLAIVKFYETQIAQAGVDATAFVEAKRTELSRQYQQQRLALAESEFAAQSVSNQFLMDSLNSLASTATSSITGLINGTMSAREAMTALGNVILSEAVGALVQIGVQYIKNAMISQAADKALMATKAANAALYTAAITAQVTGTTALAAQAAFASTAAIPVVGPAAAPAAAAAAGAAAAALGAPAIASAPIAGARQYGGPVSAGSLYRVNETGESEVYTSNNGQQYFLPTADGSITPAGSTSSGGSGAAASGQTNIDIDVQVIVQGDGSASSSTKASGVDQATAKALGEMVAAGTKKTMLEELRPNGLLWKLKNGQA